MARRSGFIAAIARANRQAVAAQNRQIRENQRIIRENERYQRQLSIQQRQYEKELRQQYLEDRQRETDENNEELNERLAELESLLEHTLDVDDSIPFQSLKTKSNFQSFQLPALLKPKAQPQKQNFQQQLPVKSLGFLEKMLHGENGKNNRLIEHREKESQASSDAYQNALKSWQTDERVRLEKVGMLRAEYETSRQKHLAEIQQQNNEIDELEKLYKKGDPEVVTSYNVMVLERSVYPENFPQEFRVAYVPESKELVIDYELPDVEIVPKEGEYKFVKTKDEIQNKPRKPSDVKAIYQDVVASVCLRTLHEVFEADQANQLSVVTFNGFVQTVDRTTGRDIKPYLTSVRVTKDRFLEIDLRRIDKKACLRNLGAQVSPQPDECVPVKPIVDFNMVDNRFVEGSDILSELDARPNLMELTPFEFENLIGNLFSQMNLDTRQTQTSRDGGVDVIAFDTRPVLGGKVVIQAKRYKNTIGVAAVRELYGTMINEGASKGILVTTSGYGTSAFDFAKDKPVELIDGSGLLYLLDQHANIKAKIIMPIET